MGKKWREKYPGMSETEIIKKVVAAFEKKYGKDAATLLSTSAPLPTPFPKLSAGGGNVGGDMGGTPNVGGAIQTKQNITGTFKGMSNSQGSHLNSPISTSSSFASNNMLNISKTGTPPQALSSGSLGLGLGKSSPFSSTVSAVQPGAPGGMMSGIVSSGLGTSGLKVDGNIGGSTTPTGGSWSTISAGATLFNNAKAGGGSPGANKPFGVAEGGLFTGGAIKSGFGGVPTGTSLFGNTSGGVGGTSTPVFGQTSSLGGGSSAGGSINWLKPGGGTGGAVGGMTRDQAANILHQIYSQYAPEKATASNISHLLDKYKGREQHLVDEAKRKYKVGTNTGAGAMTSTAGGMGTGMIGGFGNYAGSGSSFLGGM